MGASWSSSSSAKEANSIIRPVAVVEVDREKDDRSRRLTYLLRANHINHSVIYHELEFHNHLPHILGSAYFLGGTADHLNDIYDAESKELEPWPDSPEEIGPHDWKRHLGDKNYQRAFLDFFEDEVVNRNYDWKATVMYFLTEGDQPLLNGLIGGVGHPLIHLGYAIEMDNREVAMEALAMAASAYNKLHQYVDNPHPALPYITFATPLEALARIREEQSFDNLFSHPGYENIDKVLGRNEAQVILYFNSLVIRTDNLSEIYEGLVDAATLLFVTGQKKGDPQYDFFLVHLVTTAHAMRVVLPKLSLQQAWHVIRSHWVLFVLVYVAQMRPLIKKELLDDVDLDGKDWKYVEKMALEGEAKFDAHYVKGLRSFLEFEKLYDSKDGLYLKAAVKFASEFKDWIGFGSGDAQLDIKK